MTKRAGVASPKNLTGAPKAVTANRLADGAVVFRCPDGVWSPALPDAEVASDAPAADALLAAARADADRALVVEPYLIDLAEADGGFVPLALRERIRAAGPTIAEV
jgi:hypothetical protein